LLLLFRISQQNEKTLKKDLQNYSFDIQDLPSQYPEFLKEYLPRNPTIQTICKMTKLAYGYTSAFAFLSTILLETYG